MSELISRLKEIIEKYNAGCYNETCNPFDSCTDCVLKQIREVIESQPSADQWIPCSERLPNNTDYVLITTQYGVILTVFRGMSGNWCYLDGRRLDSQDTPVAWMPLPEAYKGDEYEHD